MLGSPESIMFANFLGGGDQYYRVYQEVSNFTELERSVEHIIA